MTRQASFTSSTDAVTSAETWVDWTFFLFGGAAAGWLAVLLLDESLQPRHIWVLVIFWVALAYLVLPRVHLILTRIYIPDYFMGRTRTSDGLFGDPVNLAFRGREEQLREAMERAGWTAAEPVTLATSRRIVVDSILHRSYPAAPVSPLFLFGRQQDFAYQQEIDGNPRRRHHLRFWRCPDGWLLPGGIAVDWLAAAAYDRSVGVSFFTLQVTHRIGPDIDAERDYVASSLTASGTEMSVHAIKDFSTGYHSRNGGGDSFETDGDLPIVDVGQVPIPPGQPPMTAAGAAGTDVRRPAPTLIGAVLVLLRAVAALAAAGGLCANGHDLAGALSVLFACVEISLAVFILRGGNRARLAAMSLSAVAIILQLASDFSGAGVSLRTNLVGYSLDVLLLLALSSERARIFAHSASGTKKRPAAGAGRFLRS